MPNFIPVGPATILDLQARLSGLQFDDLYGFTSGRSIVGGASDAVEASFIRYPAAIGPE